MLTQRIKPLLVNASWLLFARILTIAARAAYVVLLAKVLGPELYGMIAYGQSWYLAFLPFTGLGLTTILCREVGRNREQGALVSTQTLILRSVSSIIVFIICVTVALILEDNFHIQKLLLIFAVALLGRALSNWAESVFLGYEANYYNFRQEASFRTMEIILGASVLVLGGGIIAVAVVHTISWWAQGLYGLLLVRRNIIIFQSAWYHLRMLSRLLAQGFPVLVGGTFIAWLLQGPFILFRYNTANMANLGQFSLAFQVFVLISWVPLVVLQSALPAMSRSSTATQNKNDVYLDFLVRAVLLAGGIVGLFGLGMASTIVNILFGKLYDPAGHLLGVTLWLLIPWTIAQIAYQVLIVRGRFFMTALGVLCGSAVFTLSFSPLVSSMGSYGAILAAGLGLFLWAAMLLLLLTGIEGIHLWRALPKPMLAVLLPLGFFLALRGYTSPFLLLPASMVLLAIVTLALGIFSAEERLALKKMITGRISN